MEHINLAFEKASAVIQLDDFLNCGRQCDADNILNDIVLDILQNNGLDQLDAYGQNRDQYHLTLYKQPENSLGGLQTFYFRDFLFPDKTLADAYDTDSYMRMLDRNKLADAMRSALIEKFGLEVNPDAPLFWRRDILQCSHPDYRKRAEFLPNSLVPVAA